MYINIQCGGQTLQRKVKFVIKIDDDEYQCISAQQASLLLKQSGHNLTQADVYNWADPNRRKKRLTQRFPKTVVITKV